MTWSVSWRSWKTASTLTSLKSGEMWSCFLPGWSRIDGGGLPLPGDVTSELSLLKAGSPDGWAKVIPKVYGELHRP